MNNETILDAVKNSYEADGAIYLKGSGGLYRLAATEIVSGENRTEAVHIIREQKCTKRDGAFRQAIRDSLRSAGIAYTA